MYPHKVIHTLSRQRGATLISVLLLIVSLLTIGALAVRSSVRELQSVSSAQDHSRALAAARTALGVAAGQIRETSNGCENPDIAVPDDAAYPRLTYPGPNTGQDHQNVAVSALLAGSMGGNNCGDPCGDCVPARDAGDPITGQRNWALTGVGSDCGGTPCMRPGAIMWLRNLETRAPKRLCGSVPGQGMLSDVVPGADPDANVTVWIRNNAADGLRQPTFRNDVPVAHGTMPGWETESDCIVVLTAMAEVNGSVATVESTLYAQSSNSFSGSDIISPDEGYGSGHNNDNTAISRCMANATAAQN